MFWLGSTSKLGNGSFWILEVGKAGSTWKHMEVRSPSQRSLLQVQVEPRLREPSLGKFEGMVKSETLRCFAHGNGVWHVFHWNLRMAWVIRMVIMIIAEMFPTLWELALVDSLLRAVVGAQVVSCTFP